MKVNSRQALIECKFNTYFVKYSGHSQINYNASEINTKNRVLKFFCDLFKLFLRNCVIKKCSPDSHMHNYR